MNLNHHLPNDDEIKSFYTLFCEIFTAFHNYAIGKTLFEKKVYSWSFVSYYYSLMHCGRTICFMSLNCFPKRHEDLHKFLSGDRINNSKFWKLAHPEGVRESHDFNELIRGLPRQNNLIESKIKKFGEHLRKIQKVREFNSYEMFIVAHQIGHQVLSPELEAGAVRIRNIVEDCLIFVIDLLYDYVRQKSDYFKAFLLDRNQNYKWGFDSLIQSLESQRVAKVIINEIKETIRNGLLNKISIDIGCPDEFYDKISFELFHEKRGIIYDFIRDIGRVNRNETN